MQVLGSNLQLLKSEPEPDVDDIVCALRLGRE